MNDFKFGTKAETLSRLGVYADCFKVPTFYYFSKSKWLKHKNDVFEEIINYLPIGKVAVRSSSVIEDSEDESLSGAFDTKLNIDVNNRSDLQDAIMSVFSSFPPNSSTQDQVLVQAMVDNVEVSGVIMTHMVDDGSPYYVFNYDDETKKTDTITGGIGAHKTVLIHRDTSENLCESVRLKKILQLARKIEDICQNNALDIEFCLDNKGVMHLLQVRRITNTKSWSPTAQSEIASRIQNIENYFQNLSAARVGLYGNRTILGNMPDWNPAEIIGVRPSPLASSLYRNLITSGTWARARAQMGYRKIPKSELMVMVSGSPYIDIRVSLNSFLPENLSPDTSSTLINAWLNRLSNKPELHDKIEFEIVPTAYDFDFKARFESFYKNLLNQNQLNDYGNKLRSLTNNALNLSKEGSLNSAMESIGKLVEIQSDLGPSSISKNGPIATVSWLSEHLDHCIEHGTLPFSILARHAFIAETLIRSLIRLGAISKERVAIFKNSFSTVLGQLSDDVELLNESRISERDFLDKYGHLRPGTYDIMATSYKERDHVLKDIMASKKRLKPKCFKLTADESEKINKLILSAGFSNITASTFFEYARQATVGREYSKFVFTKSLSAVIDTIIQWGSFYQLGREELSYLKIEDIFATYISASSDDPAQFLTNQIKTARSLGRRNRLVKMGYLIRSIGDLHVVPIHRSTPNFITENQIEAKAIFLNSRSTNNHEIQGKIVCIENADPGFDWIFSKNIVGLITKYGGVNSHMSIRCAEMNLPAAIGCGEIIFSSISDGCRVLLSGKTQMVKPVGE